MQYRWVLWGVFAFLIVSSAYATLDIQQASLEFGSSSQEKSSELMTITLRKEFILRLSAGSVYSNFDFDFTGNNNFQRSNLDIVNRSVIVNASGGDQTQPFFVNLTVPRDFDAVNDNLEPTKFSVGRVKMKAKINGTSAEETSDEMELFLQVKNNLAIESVTIEREDESEVSVSRGNTVGVTGGERIKVEFKIKNNFENATGTSFDSVTVDLESSDLGLDESEDTNGVEPGSTVSLRMSFTIDDDETGTFDVFVKASGEDEYQGLHGVKYDFKFNVAEAVAEPDQGVPEEDDSDGDGVLDLEDFCPLSTPNCAVDSSGCELDSDNDGICDSLDQTPRGEDTIVLGERQPTLQPTLTANVTPETSQKKTEVLSAVSTEAFAPFLIGFILGIILTAGFFIFIRS